MVFYLEKVDRENKLWCYSIYLITFILVSYFVYNSFNNHHNNNEYNKNNEYNYIHRENRVNKESKRKEVNNNIKLYNQEVYNKYSKF